MSPNESNEFSVRERVSHFFLGVLGVVGFLVLVVVVVVFVVAFFFFLVGI